MSLNEKKERSFGSRPTPGTHLESRTIISRYFSLSFPRSAWEHLTAAPRHSRSAGADPLAFPRGAWERGWESSPAISRPFSVV